MSADPEGLPDLELEDPVLGGGPMGGRAFPTAAGGRGGPEDGDTEEAAWDQPDPGPDEWTGGQARGRTG